MNDDHPKHFDSVASRRSEASLRRMSPARRIYYFFGLPVLRGLIRLLTASYRYEAIVGAENAEPFVAGKTVCAPCYWHQHQVLCSTLIHRWMQRDFKACFLVSGSVDGEVPERVARAWGAEVIRGSANRSGALALRDMHGMMKRGYSIVTTADGQRGPKDENKAGAILMARIDAVPIIPIACAANRAWYLDRWDNFMIPKPFARVVIGVGEPCSVPPDLPLDEIEPYRQNVQDAVMSLMRECEHVLQNG